MKDEYGTFLVAYGGLGSCPIEMLLPVVKAMEWQIAEGIDRFGTKRALVIVKSAFCRPASKMWHPGMSLEEARWESRNSKSVRSYKEMEDHLMKHFSQSMDIEPDTDEFLIGNKFDTCVYLVSKSMDSVWRIPSKRAAGPCGSNVF